MTKLLLIDGDELAYKSSCPKTTWQGGWNLYKTKRHALQSGEVQEDLIKNFINPHPSSVTTQIDSMIKKILNRCKEHFVDITSFNVQPVVSGEGNFRKDTYPTYKENRKDRDRPFYLDMAKKYLVTKWNAKTSKGEEADDLIGILSGGKSIIASSDKDFLTIPGNLYNIMHDEFTVVSVEDSWRNFYMQIMIGDVADNVVGLPKVGPVKARKLLENVHDKREMLQLVIQEFINRGLSEGDVARTGFLLYIRQRVDEHWSIQKVLAGEI